MSERPILFSAPMVRALLDGRKTQTRRAVKITHRTPGLAAALETQGFPPRTEVATELCPYGKPGDRMWVREALSIGDSGLVYAVDHSVVRHMPAGWEDVPRRPHVTSMFMPRWASRITLEITDVRVQRVQDISEEDAQAEGVEPLKMTAEDIADIQISDESPKMKELARLMGPGQFSHKAEFHMLWNSINGVGSWDANPWVWALTFKSGSTPND